MFRFIYEPEFSPEAISFIIILLFHHLWQQSSHAFHMYWLRIRVSFFYFLFIVTLILTCHQNQQISLVQSAIRSLSMLLFILWFCWIILWYNYWGKRMIMMRKNFKWDIGRQLRANLKLYAYQIRWDMYLYPNSRRIFYSKYVWSQNVIMQL